mmetsp:Transcript_56682/g.93728  ORF Transcript_56682/g.93728 Transcript_56682/m.93728 type:complete len:584 (-) Transcript_56682:127-1878(-)
MEGGCQNALTQFSSVPDSILSDSKGNRGLQSILASHSACVLALPRLRKARCAAQVGSDEHTWLAHCEEQVSMRARGICKSRKRKLSSSVCESHNDTGHGDVAKSLQLGCHERPGDVHDNPIDLTGDISCSTIEALERAISWQPPALEDMRGCGMSRLHHELVQLANLAITDSVDLEQRCGVLRRVLALVTSSFPGAHLALFGSCATGLSVPDSDLDLVATTFEGAAGSSQQRRQGKHAAIKPLRKLARLFVQRKLTRASDCEVVYAKVPIIKFIDQQSGMSVDLSVNATNGEQNSEWVRRQLRQEPMLRPVVIALKLLLRRKGLHETYSGGIGSYLLIVMVVEQLRRSSVSCAGDMGELLSAFLQYYSTPACLSRRRGEEVQMSMQDPMNSAADIGKRAFRFRQAQVCFAEWAMQLQRGDMLWRLLACGDAFTNPELPPSRQELNDLCSCLRQIKKPLESKPEHTGSCGDVVGLHVSCSGGHAGRLQQARRVTIQSTTAKVEAKRAIRRAEAKGDGRSRGVVDHGGPCPSCGKRISAGGLRAHQKNSQKCKLAQQGGPRFMSESPAMGNRPTSRKKKVRHRGR